LWTSSYVLYTAGLGLQGLALCYWLIEVQGWRRWATPFLVLGSNAITVFVLSGLGARLLGLIKVGSPGAEAVTLKGYLYGQYFTSWLSPLNASLAFALAYVWLWMGLMSVLYWRRIFIRL
jgi:predicted acyltransferase